MVEVITMPPINYTAVSQALENPRSVSTGISGAPRFSQTRAARRKFGVSIHGIGTDMAGQGWMEQLRRRLNGQAPIVQIEVIPDHWYLAHDAARNARGQGPLAWTNGGNPLLWTFQSMPLTWWNSDLTVTAGSNNGGAYIDVTGLDANKVIAYPGEKVMQGATVGRVVNVARTNAAGAARIYVDVAFTSGIVQLGPREWAYAYINDMPATTQPSGAGYTYEWSMTEVFATDFASFELIQPWR